MYSFTAKRTWMNGSVCPRVSLHALQMDHGTEGFMYRSRVRFSLWQPNHVANPESGLQFSWDFGTSFVAPHLVQSGLKLSVSVVQTPPATPTKREKGIERVSFLFFGFLCPDVTLRSLSPTRYMPRCLCFDSAGFCSQPATWIQTSDRIGRVRFYSAANAVQNQCRGFLEFHKNQRLPRPIST